MNYWKEKEQCPHYKFVQNPTDNIGRGQRACIHSSPNIGGKRISKLSGLKDCTHGDYKNESTEYTCRIITTILNKGIEQLTLQEFLT